MIKRGWRAVWCLMDLMVMPCMRAGLLFSWTEIDYSEYYYVVMVVLTLLPPLPNRYGWSAADRILDRNMAGGGCLKWSKVLTKECSFCIPCPVVPL